MNIRGETGIINSQGKPGFGSELVDCRDNEFWINIEDGIKSTVEAIVHAGLFTVSSCQGHSESCPYRCVSIIAEQPKIRAIQLMISKVNNMLEKEVQPIRYYLLEVQKAFSLYENEFIDPRIIDIVFGDFREKDTFDKQRLFEELICRDELHDKEYIDERIVRPYLMQKGNHIDQYS